MAQETQDPQNTEASFPDPDDFENYDEVDYETVEFDGDSFELNTADFETEGCACV